MRVSILTATYNRAELLDRLYTSIIVNSNLSNLEVEWLIMDDGSTDNTERIVGEYIKENILDIKYFKQENQGKMVAINNLMQIASGNLIIECDSDDYFTRDAFLIIENAINSLSNLDEIYALVFLKNTSDGQNMGNEFIEDNYKSTMFDLYFKEGITGEKALVYNAKKRRRFEYKLEKDEKFVTEARLHHKMDLQYYVLCFNKPIMICQYQEEGYSKNINEMFIKYPRGYYEYFKEIFEQDFHGVTLKKRLYIYKHYILFSVLINKKHLIKNVKGLTNKILVSLLYLPGKMMTKIKFRKCINKDNKLEKVEDEKIITKKRKNKPKKKRKNKRRIKK